MYLEKGGGKNAKCDEQDEAVYLFMKFQREKTADKEAHDRQGQGVGPVVDPVKKEPAHFRKEGGQVCFTIVGEGPQGQQETEAGKI